MRNVNNAGAVASAKNRKGAASKAAANKYTANRIAVLLVAMLLLATAVTACLAAAAAKRQQQADKLSCAVIMATNVVDMFYEIEDESDLKDFVTLVNEQGLLTKQSDDLVIELSGSTKDGFCEAVIRVNDGSSEVYSLTCKKYIGKEGD